MDELTSNRAMDGGFDDVLSIDTEKMFLVKRISFIKICFTNNLHIHGGARRDRTADLRLAKPALSQLSYGPWFSCKQRVQSHKILAFILLKACRSRLRLVGLGRFELPTSPLSGVRSNQLSYRPKKTVKS